MGSLIGQLLEDQKKDLFFRGLVFDPAMLPELMLLGTLEHKEIPTDDGKLYEVDIIHYEGK